MSVQKTSNQPLPQIKDYTNPANVKPGGHTDAAVQLGKNIDAFYKGQLTNSYKQVQSDANGGKPNVQHQAQLAGDIATLHNLQQQYYKQAGDADNAAKFDETKGGKANYIDGVEGVSNTNDILSAAGSLKQDQDFTYTGIAKNDGDNTSNFQVTAQAKGAGGLAQGTSGFEGAGSGNATTSSSSSSADGSANWSGTSGGATVSGSNYSASNGATKWNQVASGSTLNGFSPQDKADALIYAQNNNIKLQNQNAPGAQANIAAISKNTQGLNLSDVTTNAQTYQKLLTALS